MATIIGTLLVILVIVLILFIAVSERSISARCSFGKTMPDHYIAYEITRGDSLTSIARMFGTTVDSLKEINHGLDPNVLVPGRMLLIG